MLLAVGVLVLGGVAAYVLGWGGAPERGEVREDNQIAAVDVSQCPEGMGMAPCVARLLADMAANDPAGALRAYTTAVGAGAEAFQECHGAHHILGNAAGSALSIEELLKIDPGTCGQGFIHGAIAGYLDSIEKGTAASAGVVACETIATLSTDTGLYDNCRHALGHRLVVDGTKLDEIETYCASGRQHSFTSCVAGGFMQLFTDEVGKKPRDLTMTTAQAETCNRTEGVVAEGCWLGLMASLGGFVSKMPPATMANLCLGSSAPAKCALGAGEAYGLAAVGESERAVATLVAQCAPMREQTETCLVGGVRQLHGAATQDVLSVELLQASLRQEIPAQYREAVRSAIAQRTGS